MDGQVLVEGNSLPTVAISSGPTQEQTIVMPTAPVTHPAPAYRKPKRKAPWIIAASLLMLVLVAVSGWYELTASVRSYNTPAIVYGNANRNAANAAAARNAASPATPRSTPTPEPAAATPQPIDETSSEVTPIQWTTAAVTFNTAPGRSYRFQCSAGGDGGVVWGSDVYTTGSSICPAAVHAGVITMEGGEITIEMRPGRTVYGSTQRNGITSNPSGEYPSSFVVRKPEPQKKTDH